MPRFPAFEANGNLVAVPWSMARVLTLVATCWRWGTIAYRRRCSRTFFHWSCLGLEQFFQEADQRFLLLGFAIRRTFGACVILPERHLSGYQSPRSSIQLQVHGCFTNHLHSSLQFIRFLLHCYICSPPVSAPSQKVVHSQWLQCIIRYLWLPLCRLHQHSIDKVLQRFSFLLTHRLQMSSGNCGLL